MLALSVFINYVDRGNLSIAAPLIKDELHLTASQLGILLSSFFYTYALFQMPAGWAVDRFSAGKVLALGFFIWSSATAATGLVHGFAAMLCARLVLGFGEAVAYPSYSNILTRHVPATHRGFANAVIALGQATGPAFATLAGGLLIGRFGWRMFFIALGVGSLLWLIPWWKVMPSDDHTQTAAKRDTLAAFREILSQRAAWGSCIGLFAGNYVLYLLLTWLPFYLVHERHFSLAYTAKIGASAFVIKGAVAITSGWLSDRWVQSGTSETVVRKTLLCTGLLGASTLLLFAVVTSDQTCIKLLMIGAGFLGFATPQNFAVSQALAGPQRAGTWTGVQNFIGNLAGTVAPTLTGIAVDRFGGFFWAFVMNAVVACVGAYAWIFLIGRIELVQWKTKTSG